MARKGIISILAGYFNQGTDLGINGKPGKRSLPEFRDELKELSDAEKMELATAVCEITGDTILITEKG